MFKNMKIEINEQQPLDEVVRELKSLGYRKIDFDVAYKPSMIIAFADGEMHNYYKFNENLIEYKTTTLAELSSMNVEALKEM